MPRSNVRVSSGVPKLFCSAFSLMMFLRWLVLALVSVAGGGCSHLAAPAGGRGTAPRFDTRMKSLAVRVLGDFGVDGVEPQALGSRKARLALQLLALAAGQVVPSDVLVDALWDDAPPARPDDQLAVLMSRLRSVLGRDRIEHRDRGYLLRSTGSTRPSWPRSPTRWSGGAARATWSGPPPRPGSRSRCSAAPGPCRYPVSGRSCRQAELERLASRGRGGSRPPRCLRPATGWPPPTPRPPRWNATPTTRRRCGCSCAPT